MKLTCFLFLCFALIAGCEQLSNNTEIDSLPNANASVTFLIEIDAGINVEIQLHDKTGMSKETKNFGSNYRFFDADGQKWTVSVRNGVSVSDLIAVNFSEYWSHTGQSQHYFFKSFPTVPALPEDPMVDGPALCSVLLDLSGGWFMWFRREADTIPCLNPENYSHWLPVVNVSNP